MQPHDLIVENFKITQTQREALAKLGLKQIKDLLYHFPNRYSHIGGTMEQMKEIGEKEQVTIFGFIKKIKTGRTFRGHRPLSEAIISDGTATIKALWFNQPYIAKLFSEGTFVRLDGVTGKKNRASQVTLLNPQIEKVEEMPIFSADSLFEKIDEKEIQNKILPIYPETKGITSNWFYHAMQKIFKSDLLEQVFDTIPPEILKKYNLPSLKTALIWIHLPQKESDALAARKRFAFEEIFYIQIAKQMNRQENSQLNSYVITKTSAEIKKFTNRFPFEMTTSQKKAVSDILQDLGKKVPMTRLLEGDVGSGKTAVAATAIYATVTTNPEGKEFENLQAAYMAPTEILAQQHFENFVSLFGDIGNLGIKIGLITGSGCWKFPSKVNPKEATKISKTQLLKWVESGEIPILIGTHSLIQKTVKFKNLALIIIDEQHRFGTKQRQSLARKEKFAPHLLSMTATPIPRTLSLTIYGDLDLTLLEEMPHGRKPIITQIVTPQNRSRVYEEISESISTGRQAFVICPRINAPDPEKEFAIYAKSVKDEAKRLRTEIFPKFEIGELYSTLKPAEKEKVMANFIQNKIQILVSTSMVEVGVNVPNSTSIIIEGAERFGLSQLHQLRGRVIRSNHQAQCYIFTDSKSERTLDRLKALITAKNGFELAEHDLRLRGAGELAGNKQWGISDLGMEAIKNLKMVEAARTEAINLVEKNPNLEKYPKILAKIENSEKIHFE